MCKDRGDEFFRFRTEEEAENCKTVYRCNRARDGARVTKIQCPQSLAFDIVRQTCNWKPKVKNCDVMTKPKKVLPLLVTDEPLCPENQLACGSGQCMERTLFCDGEYNCDDQSDENACEVGVDPNGADLCDSANCALPNCFCSVDGTRIPNDIEPEETPQMVAITFHGAVNVDNIGLFTDIFRDELQNPNGCSAKGTFFVSHKYSNYSAIQELHRKGHEIGVFSITNRNDPDYWSEGTFDDWTAEMVGARDIVENFANITDGSLIGLRAPQLRVGGNAQFQMMSEFGFYYDSSITAPLNRLPLWPYSLDYRMPHKCLGTAQKCPSQSHPIWEMVINELDLRIDPNSDERLPGCHLLSSCNNIDTPEQFKMVLMKNFERHYSTNRAPLGLHFTAEWLNKKGFKQQLIEFMKELQKKNDVFFVTNTQILQWMEEPTRINAIREFSQWKEKCEVKGLPYCSIPNACQLTSRELPGERIYLNTCMECPKNYPWIEDYTGNGFDL